MRFVFEVAGDVQVNRELIGLSARGRDMSPAFDVILDLWIEETTEQFASEGGHASGGWKQLQPVTIARKRREGLRPEILRATDRMMQSLTRRGDSDMIATVSPSELDYGSSVPYTRFHQTGTRKMPQRRPVEFTEPTRRATLKILQRFLVTGEAAPL